MSHSDTANDLVLGDRNSSYGSPHADFAGVAMMWSGLLNAKLKERITATEVGLMMTALKLRRHAHKPKDDNLVDAHGYLTCIEWIEAGSPPIPKATELQRALEDVCVGTLLTCPKCEKKQPCLCDK